MNKQDEIERVQRELHAVMNAQQNMIEADAELKGLVAMLDRYDTVETAEAYMKAVRQRPAFMQSVRDGNALANRLRQLRAELGGVQ